MSISVSDLVRVRSRHPEAIAEAAARRARRPLVGGSGRLLIVAADHPARGALAVGERALAMANRADLLERRGRVRDVIGLVVEASGLDAEVGEVCLVETGRDGRPVPAEVVGFRGSATLLMPLGEMHGIGPGKPVDTNRFFVVCTNVLGGCQGSTGPSSTNPETGRAYGTAFPFVTIRDMVRAQKLLLDHLGVLELHAVIGGSMGGMLALLFAIKFPRFTRRVVAMATTARESAQAIAFNAASFKLSAASQSQNRATPSPPISSLTRTMMSS